MLQILHHVRGPVVINLEASHLHTAVMDIDPVIRNNIADRLLICFVFQMKVRNQNADGHIITIRQPCRDACRLLRHIVHACHEILDRHGGNDNIPCLREALSILLVGDGVDDVLRVPVNPNDLRVHNNPAAKLLHLGSRHIPEFTGAKLRIGEFLNERGLDLAVLSALFFLDGILEDSRDGYALDTLRTPGRVDLTRMASPEVLRIMLKEHRIQLLAKTVDVEILERILLPLMNAGGKIAESRLHGIQKSHVPERLSLQRNRIVEELLVEKNTGYAPSAQHDAVRLLRIRTARHHARRASKHQIVLCRGALCRQHLLPPLIHLRNLGEETMPAHVHPVAMIIHRAGDAAERAALLKHDHIIFPVTLFQKLISGGQAGRTCSDNQRFFHSNTSLRQNPRMRFCRIQQPSSLRRHPCRK